MFTLISLLSLTLLVSANALQCPTNQTYVAMPALDPVQFSYRVQISVQDENTTFDAYEFYDNENQTIYLSIAETNGSDHIFDRTRFVYDYKNNQTFIVEENNGASKVCTVEDLNSTMPHRVSLFGVGIEKGPSNVKNAFHWNGTFNVTYQGNDTVIDGIPTDHYQTCLSFDDGNWTYLIDVYFNNENWTMPYGQRSPVLLTLNATDNMNVSHLYTYRFFDYQPYQVPRTWRPTKPHDIICPGRKDAPTLNPFSHQFQFESEMHFTINNYKGITRISEWYDYDKNLFRLDTVVRSVTSLSTVHDFNSGLSYTIDRMMNNCTIGPIPINSSYLDSVWVANSSLVRLRSPEEFGRMFNLTFGGYRQYSGVPAHVWIGQSPLETKDIIHNGEKAFILETYYFSSDEWSGDYRLLGILEKHVSQINSTYNITDYLEGEVFNFEKTVNIDSFDVSLCFDVDMKETVVLKFSAEDEAKINGNVVAFNNAFIAAVANHANIPPLRTKLVGDSYYETAPSSVQAELNNQNDGGYYVWITLFDAPGVKGDSVDMKPQKNLTVALNSLQAVVKNNDFEVTFTNSQNKNVTVTAFSEYWMTEEDLLYPSLPSPPPPSSNGLSTGLVVGVAFGMIIVGLLLGYVIRSCRAKRSGIEYAGLL